MNHAGMNKDTKAQGSTGPSSISSRATPAARHGRLSLQLEWAAILLVILWVVWLAALARPVADLFSASVPGVRRALLLAGITAFVAVYGWTAWHNALRYTLSALPRSPGRYVPVVALAALSLALSLAAGTDWLLLFIFTSASAAGYLAVRPAAATIATLVGLTLCAGLLTGAQGKADLLWEVTIRVATVGISVASLTQAILLGRALQAARAEIARMAVAQERLRFARDLHDLLGHSLSLITLKSELAARLVDTSPQRAGAEIRDVVGVARTALREVREAVAGYRQPALSSELQGAKEMLSAAGIAFECSGCDLYGEAAGGSLPLPAQVEAALAWTLREGVTNVIRHSRARHCLIELSRSSSSVRLGITDDGTPGVNGEWPGVSSPRSGSSNEAEQADRADRAGSGLAGLRERVQALQGSYEAGPLATGGFRLSVTLPLSAGKEVASEPLHVETDGGRANDTHNAG